MAHVKTICATAATFLITAVLSVSGQFGTESNQKLSEARPHSRSYFDEISYVNKLAQHKQYFESFSVQEKLHKLSEKLLTLSGTFMKHVYGQPSTNVTDSHDAVNMVNFQELLLSASEKMAVSTSSSACVNDTKLVIVSVFKGEKWALHLLDSFGKPGPGLALYRFNFVGDYSQCRGISVSSANGSQRFNGNYCTLKASLGPPSPLDLLAIQLGVCLPDTCSAEENTLFVNEAELRSLCFNTSNFFPTFVDGVSLTGCSNGYTIEGRVHTIEGRVHTLEERVTKGLGCPPQNVGLIHLLGINGTLQAEAAECHTEDTEMTAVTVVSIVALVIIGMLMVIGTGFDIIFIQRPKWKATTQSIGCPVGNPATQANNHIINEEGNQEPITETTGLLAKAISNQQESSSLGICPRVLLAFSVYTNGSKVLNTSQPEGSLSAIHGIRFLSMSWVLLGHVLVFGIQQFGNVISLFLVWLKDWSFDAVSNAFVSVDTFFTLSGLLTAYLTLNEIKQRGWKINWPLFYFHRFWRLTPPYMLTLLVVTGLQQYLGSGPLWPSMEPADKENCENNWWTNLLYISNLVNVENMCFGHSWYLANDMQFYLLSPLMIVPFYFNRFIGMAVCLLFLLVSWITTGVLSAQNAWPPTLISASPQGGYQTFQEHYYIKPWCRMGPYIVGLMAGAYLSQRRDKRIPALIVMLGWVAAVATGLAVVYGLHGDISGEHVSSVSVAALYNAVARSAWGACVSWVIIACSAGYGGFVNSILSWSPFVVLGRLTYMAYLIHPCLMYVYFQNQERLYYLSYINLTMTFCGLVVITNMAAFVLMLGFESPWIGLERIFIYKKKKS